MPRISSEAAAHLGRAIREKRNDLGLTQERLGQLSDVGSSNLRSYEKGNALPNLFTLMRIATALKVEPGALLEGLNLDMFPEHRNRSIP